MFDFAQPPITALKGFFRDNEEATQNAALLLGGPPALQRTRSLIADVAAADRPNGRLRRELAALYALLTLEHVHDLDRSESYYSSLIDPTSPQVDEICRLSDALAAALSTIPAPGFAAAVATDGMEDRQ